MQDVQGHVELRFVCGRRPDQLALCVGRDDGAVSQGEPVQRAEGVAVPQHCTETETSHLMKGNEARRCRNARVAQKRI